MKNADLENKAAFLRPEELAQRRAELEPDHTAFQAEYDKAQTGVADMESKLIADVLGQTRPIVEGIAREEGYSIIFNADSLVWFDPIADLTNKVIGRSR